ncbi:MAG: sulfotransferase [Hyphomicrobiales bacterium]|nr:MAG: sulfotransferase [Hyphomicrobiales bacterium]
MLSPGEARLKTDNQSTGLPAAGKTKNPVPKNSLRFWHGMRFSTWWRELTLNQFDVSPGRWRWRAIVITITSLFNSLLAALDGLIYGQSVERAPPPHGPIFILGHWRSGTTYLHELLTCDPAYSYPTTYRCFAPHHFLLTERALKPLLGFLLPKRRPMDDMAVGWERPMEEEFALANLGVPSPYLAIMFPNRGARHSDYLALNTLDEPSLKSWKREYLRFLKRLTKADDRRLVLKSPTNTARLGLLLDMFPDARFIHLTREPSELYISTHNMWQSLHREQGMQELAGSDWLGPSVLDALDTMYAAYCEDRRRLGPNQLFELSYEDLIADPKGQLAAIYETLELGDFGRAEPALDAYLSTVRDYRPGKLPVPAEAQQVVSDRWGHYAEAFGYK